MEFYVEGKQDGPLVVCIHALMGGPEDFVAYRERWAKHCCIVLMDMDVEARELGWGDQKSAAMALDYSGKGDEIANYIRKTFPGRRAYFVGVSLGGKILYDIAGKHSDIFMGGVVTDTGLGSLADSEFATEARDGVYTLDLDKPWNELKRDLEVKFPDRKTRILISTQLHYPDPKGPAVWKPGLGIIYDLITRGEMEYQWNLVPKMNPDSKIIVLRSLARSGIGEKDHKRMKEFKVFDFMDVPESNHFFHISSHEYVSQALMYLIGEAPRPVMGKKKRDWSLKLPPVWKNIVQSYQIQKLMEKQIVKNLQPGRIEHMHPAILPNILRKLEPRMLRKLDIRVIKNLDPEAVKVIPKNVLEEIDRILAKHRKSSTLEIFTGINLRPAFAALLILALCLVTFFIVHDARGAESKVQSVDGKMQLDERGKKIAKDIENFHTGFKGENSEMEMVLVTADGKEVIRRMKGKTLEGADKKSFKSTMEFLWPPDIKGTKILIWNEPNTDNSQWVYLPSVKRVKRIAARNVSASFMGSEFTYEDLGGRAGEKFDYKMVEENGKDTSGKDAWVLEIYPRGDTSGYSKIKTWIVKEIYSPSQIEYFDRKGELLKVAKFLDYKKFDKWWRVGQIDLTNVQTKKKTVLKWTKRELGKAFGESDFSPEAMSR